MGRGREPQEPQRPRLARQLFFLLTTIAAALLVLSLFGRQGRPADDPELSRFRELVETSIYELRVDGGDVTGKYRTSTQQEASITLSLSREYVAEHLDSWDEQISSRGGRVVIESPKGHFWLVERSSLEAYMRVAQQSDDQRFGPRNLSD